MTENNPHIILNIPQQLTREFLGILAIDILHDAKGRGYLVGNKLAQLTDLITLSILSHTQRPGAQTNEHMLKMYIFQQVLVYFVDLWESRITALGIDTRPDFSNTDNSYWETLRETVMLPFRNVADRDTEDTFISLGQNKAGIEPQNYHEQKERLTCDHAEILAFVSPQGVYKPSDYFLQASGIVDIIQNRANNSKVVLDMKSAAGLIRSITDPIGYITGIPTYADPGYNMPGMSAIRQHADLAFINTQDPGKYHQESNEFRYQINILTPISSIPLTVLDVRYFYGIAKDGLDRSNLMVNILEHTFTSTLPHSFTMAESLGQYLRPKAREIKITVDETLNHLQTIIWDYYTSLCQPVPFLQELNSIYTGLHNSKCVNTIFNILLQKMDLDIHGGFLLNWRTEQNTVLRSSYLLATIRNLYYFNIKLSPLKQNCLLPEIMITEILPGLLLRYITEGSKDMLLLAFCFHQYQLLRQFIGHPGSSYQQELAEMLKEQWIPRRKGKIILQLPKLVQEWQRRFEELLTQEGFYLKTYLQQLLTACHTNLGLIIDCDSIDDDTRIGAFLQTLPVFQPSKALQKSLSDQLHFYYPEVYQQTITMSRDGLLLSVLLSQKSLATIIGINSCQVLKTHVNSTFPGFDADNATAALDMVLGKFSGDFGQIMWCIYYGHLFASEDNNTSAMALLLHRLPKECILRNVPGNVTWGNIHGLGDGGSVDIIIDR